MSGTIISVHKRDFDFEGYTHHASDDDPQYEIEGDTTEHIAAHGSVAALPASYFKWNAVRQNRHPASSAGNV